MEGIVKLANEHNVVVIPFGGGTSVRSEWAIHWDLCIHDGLNRDDILPGSWPGTITQLCFN